MATAQVTVNAKFLLIGLLKMAIDEKWYGEDFLVNMYLGQLLDELEERLGDEHVQP